MVIEIKIRQCPNCDSPDIIKNGTDYKGAQKYHCHYCGGYGTLDAKARYSEKEKEQVLKAYQERVSMRGIRRIFGVVPKTLVAWIKAALKRLPSLIQTLEVVEADDVLELDELWSFVLKKAINAGFGSPYVVGPVKLWLTTAVTVVQQVVANCGYVFLTAIRAVPLTVIFGMLIKKFFRLIAIILSAKRPVRPLTSSVGTTPCVNVWLVSYAKPCLSLNPRLFTI